MRYTGTYTVCLHIYSSNNSNVKSNVEGLIDKVKPNKHEAEEANNENLETPQMNSICTPLTSWHLKTEVSSCCP